MLVMLEAFGQHSEVLSVWQKAQNAIKGASHNTADNPQILLFILFTETTSHQDKN